MEKGADINAKVELDIFKRDYPDIYNTVVLADNVIKNIDCEFKKLAKEQEYIFITRLKSKLALSSSSTIDNAQAFIDQVEKLGLTKELSCKLTDKIKQSCVI